MKLLPLAVALVLVYLNQPVLADTKQDEKRMESAFAQKDYVTTLSIAKRLAEAGNVQAQIALWVLYGDGLGIPENEELEVYWMRKAAQQGDEISMEFLDRKYSSGKGGAPKHAGYERDVWIRRMANQGDLAAQRYIDKAKKREESVRKLKPDYRSPWNDPNYAVEKD